MFAAPPVASTPSTPFVWPIRVYYEDTDAAGVVYYANYLKFCERARTEWLREAGFTNSALLAERDLAFVVRSVQAEFLASAVLDDALAVHTSLDKIGGASLTFRQTVLRGDRRLFDARIAIACINLKTQRPSPLPADVKLHFQPFRSPS
ncbi:tol-pal system-associated acyl-CoA thioesterase [Zoogloea sp.]|uniref:tol-pal system-associated acyl-CoA thioesterase n=1 Tax=Zoogloea sp. TaxID=49181 RepID=UPI001A566136|nr:tol-pal system-associated acyl-CoA thioesterase [Zoogloeaceae bacterium]